MVGRRPRKLTPRQIRVINHYMINNDQQAALESEGYHGRGHNKRFFVDNPLVTKEIRRRTERMAKKNELNEEWVISRLMKIADANLGNILLKLQDNDYDLSVLNEDELYVIEAFSEEFVVEKGGDNVKKAKVSLPSKNQALTILARKLSLLTDNLSVKADDEMLANLGKIPQSERSRTIKFMRLSNKIILASNTTNNLTIFEAVRDNCS